MKLVEFSDFLLGLILIGGILRRDVRTPGEPASGVIIRNNFNLKIKIRLILPLKATNICNQRSEATLIAVNGPSDLINS